MFKSHQPTWAWMALSRERISEEKKSSLWLREHQHIGIGGGKKEEWGSIFKELEGILRESSVL